MSRLSPVTTLLATTVAAAYLATAGAAAPRQSTWPSPIDQLLGRCPTAVEVAAVRSEISVTIDTTTGPLACTAAAGSADLTALQERVYQALLVMRALRFSQPLPWTSQSLYDWFRGAVKGVQWRIFPSAPGDTAAIRQA